MPERGSCQVRIQDAVEYGLGAAVRARTTNGPNVAATGVPVQEIGQGVSPAVPEAVEATCRGTEIFEGSH